MRGALVPVGLPSDVPTTQEMPSTVKVVENTDQTNNGQLVPVTSEGEATNHPVYPSEAQLLMEEMESVLYSISHGRQETINRMKYQAFSAAISS